MDRALLISYLRAAEEHVSNDVQDIADQRELISTLERTGHNATSAIAGCVKWKRRRRGT